MRILLLLLERTQGVERAFCVVSRVSQGHGQYLLGGSAKPAYPQASQYGHESSGFARAGAVGSRYADVYASSASASGSSWYSESMRFLLPLSHASEAFSLV